MWDRQNRSLYLILRTYNLELKKDISDQISGGRRKRLESYSQKSKVEEFGKTK
jgi:hypothetical protein